MNARPEKNQKHKMFIKKLCPFVDPHREYLDSTGNRRQVALARLIKEEENEEVFQSSVLKKEVTSTKDRKVVYFELINTAMAETDRYNFRLLDQNDENSKKINDNYYVPYFYFAVFELDKKNIDYFRNYKNVFFQNEMINEYIPCLITAHHREIEKEKVKGIHSLTVFSASPFLFAKNTIDFALDDLSEEESSEIKRLISICRTLYSWQDMNNMVVRSRNDMINHSSYFCGCPESTQIKPFVGSLKIYNVGQANCAYIRSNNNRYAMMIDVGIDKRFIKDKVNNEKTFYRNHGIVKRNYKHISTTQPKVIILTHWDMDHLLGVCLLDKKSFRANWIAPDVAENNRMALFLKRLILYLHHKQSLLMIGKEFNGEKVWSNDFISQTSHI